MATKSTKNTTSKSTGSKKKTTSTSKSSSAKRNTSSKAKSPRTSNTTKNTSTKAKQNSNTDSKSKFTEVFLWCVIGFSFLIFISNFGFGGAIGRSISSFCFNYFGIVAYVIPIIFTIAVFYCVANIRNVQALSKLACSLIFIVLISTLIELFWSDGGAIGSILVSLLTPAFGKAFTVVAILIMMIIDYIFIFDTSAFDDMKKAGEKSKDAYSHAKTAINERVEAAQEKLSESPKRSDKKYEGVSFNTTLVKTPEPVIKEKEIEEKAKEKVQENTSGDPFKMPINTQPLSQDDLFDPEIPATGEASFTPVTFTKEKKTTILPDDEITINKTPVSLPEIPGMNEENSNIGIDETEPAEPVLKKKKNTKKTKQEIQKEADIVSDIIKEKHIDEDLFVQKKLQTLPPFGLLREGNRNTNFKSGDSENMKDLLRWTFETFGVEIDGDIEYTTGPSVTRFEFKPGPGVKVAKIVGLADDIKLSLAASDIRIEAPIPGKAAVGIEVPNKEKSSVLLRDLIDSAEFANSKSKVTYAVGKDIGGNIIISDIAKMPHLLIAGATGSGKSVFINSLIMSILYKATPDEVKFIMIDPKVVELSVYNGLPHLLIPVVTDPKKAAGALNWAVAEMTKRYQAFAREGVRDIKGFNAKADLPYEPDTTPLQKMSQIVVIVDELADLMMVAPKDVEEAICRLAQLARAAGIHLVLATQRPSVNVITGLIKANMPSRIALSVTSGVDSRTIIDMNGAEKLLGNGDMLFYPTGYTKPVRIQGAYVSDEEIQRVVSYIKDNNEEATTNADITEAIENHSIGTTVTIGNPDNNNERDSYFAEAGRLIIDKDKASIGMLQRQFKIGFNRAARIMDQLHEAGIVGPEEGTKPRKILMNASEFEQYLTENE